MSDKHLLLGLMELALTLVGLWTYVLSMIGSAYFKAKSLYKTTCISTDA